MVMPQNVMLHLGEGDFIMFDEIPISTIKLPEGRFQTLTPMIEATVKMMDEIFKFQQLQTEPREMNLVLLLMISSDVLNVRI